MVCKAQDPEEVARELPKPQRRRGLLPTYHCHTHGCGLGGEPHTHAQAPLGSQNYYNASESSTEPTTPRPGFAVFLFSCACLASVLQTCCTQARYEREVQRSRQKETVVLPVFVLRSGEA